MINNVNHLKELLINYRLTNRNLTSLTQAFNDFHIPQIILKYIEEKGVTPSDNMLRLRESFQPSL